MTHHIINSSTSLPPDSKSIYYYEKIERGIRYTQTLSDDMVDYTMAFLDEYEFYFIDQVLLFIDRINYDRNFSLKQLYNKDDF